MDGDTLMPRRTLKIQNELGLHLRSASLLVAEAWGYLSRDALAEVLKLIDRELAMTWRMTQ